MENVYTCIHFQHSIRSRRPVGDAILVPVRVHFKLNVHYNSISSCLQVQVRSKSVDSENASMTVSLLHLTFLAQPMLSDDHLYRLLCVTQDLVFILPSEKCIKANV